MFGLTPFERKGYDFFNPFSDFDRDFFGGRMMAPPPPPVPEREFRTDIQETESEYVLEADLPGFKKEDISVDVEKDFLTISASHEENRDVKSSEGKFIRKERYSGTYSRSFSISGIDADNISAEYTNGVLKVNMPKQTVQQEKRRLTIN